MCRKLIYLISIVFVLVLVGEGSADPNTVAYWRFEPNDPDIYGGPPADGNSLPHSTGFTTWRKAVHDWSGNGNHLTTYYFPTNGFYWRSTVPASVIPLTGASNVLGVQSVTPNPDGFTWSAQSNPSGIDIGDTGTFEPAQWTVEASFNLIEPATGNYNTIVGRDSWHVCNQPEPAGHWDSLSALYITVRPGAQVAVDFTDVNGYNHVTESSTGLITTGTWYHIAAVSDGNTLSLYLADVNAGTGYQLVAQNDMTDSNSTNTALVHGTASGSGWTSGNWSIGRAVYAGNKADYTQGYIDEVRISNTALKPPQFLFGPAEAFNPNPEDGSVVPSTSVSLQWEGWARAAQHDVYFDTDETKVTDANRDNYEGLMHYSVGQVANSYPLTGLTFGTTYYWRIDEVNLPDIWPGNIWSFTVQPLTAYEPSPLDEAEYMDPNVDLAWSPGYAAESHDVYLGTDEDAVTDANTTNYASLGVEYWHVSDPCKDPGTLSLNTEYFWRVDEVNDAHQDKLWPGSVWSFTTEPNIPLSDDPNLVGLWTFDEGKGDRALDWSGHGNHGTLFGGPTWITGMYLGGLEFDGSNDYVSLPIGEVISLLDDCTIATWVNFSNAGGAWQRIFDFGNSSATGYMFLTPRMGADGVMRFAITLTSFGGEELVDAPTTLASGWHHVALMIEADDQTFTLYLDGSVAGETSATTLTPSALGETTNNWLGRSQYVADAYFMGSLDDFRIYNKVLTEDELRPLISPPWAWRPSPTDNATISVAPKPILTWMPGRYAAKHDVYFGTDFNDVNDATRDVNLGVLKSKDQDPCSYGPCTIDFNETYYWRIDEVNMTEDPTIWKGYVWSFTTPADYIEIDNFDQYSTRDDVRDMWKDGYDEMDTGSNITVSTAIDPCYGHEPPGPINEGTNALQFVYDNDAFVCIYVPDELDECEWRNYYYSEMEANIADLECASDWIADGAKALSLQFYGDHGNSVIGDVNQMYVAIEDGDGDVAIVKYGSDATYENMNDLKKTKWQQWNINLQRFVDANDKIDLNDVNKVYVGIGVRGNDDTVGGSGIVYFDSIRLYLPRCVPERVAAGDLSSDCDFNLEDFVMMADGWLCGAELGSPDPNLIGQWKFDETSGTTANDSIGGNHGTVEGGAVLDGSGQLLLDGQDDYVSLPIGSVIDTLDECSFAAWVDWPGTGGDWQRLFDFGHPNEPNLTDPCLVTDPNIYMFVTPSPLRFVISIAGGAAGPPEQITYKTDDDVMPSGLHCVVVTVDINDTNENNVIHSLYLDGRLIGRNTDANLVPSDLNTPTPNNWLGKSLYTVDPYLIGSYDEFRIYNRVLSEVEVAQLYCSTLARPRADLNSDGVVDFKDMVMIINKWLQETALWP